MPTINIDLKKTIDDFEGNPISGLDSNTVEATVQASIKAVESVFGKSSTGRFVEAMNKEENRIKKNLTVGDVCRRVLGEATEKADAAKKLECFNTGLKCVGDSAELTDKDRQLIVALVDESSYRAIVYGRITQIMEAEEEAEDSKSKKKK